MKKMNLKFTRSELTGILERLKNNYFPEEVRTKWKLTTIIQLKEVKNIDLCVCRKMYKSLKSPTRYTLVRT